jgi:hypothetical protein
MLLFAASPAIDAARVAPGARASNAVDFRQQGGAVYSCSLPTDDCEAVHTILLLAVHMPNKYNVSTSSP